MWQWTTAIAAILLIRVLFLTVSPAKRRRSTDIVPTMVVLGSGVQKVFSTPCSIRSV